MVEKTHDSNGGVDDWANWICDCSSGVVFQKGLNDGKKFRENQPVDALDIT